MFCSRKISVFCKVLLCPISVLLLFVACHQITDAVVQKQETPLSSSPSDTRQTPDTLVTPPTSNPSSSANTDFSDYKFYKNLVISKETSQVQAITKYFPKEDENKIIYLLQELRDQIIPQAVTSLLKRFPKTFAYLQDQEIGIGIAFNSDPEVSFVASFSANYACTPDEPNDPLDSMYGLIISYGRLAWETGNHILPDLSRNELESHVVHEMMHALMCESLTCGFYGITASLNKTEQFPKWFIEGAAEVAGGGAGRIWREINKEYKLEQLEEDIYIKEFLVNNPLVADKTLSVYQTGYLAVMYLAYLAGDEQSMTSDSLATGLDIIMSEIHSGKTLDQVIKENSQNKFSGLEDFQNNFVATNQSVVKFSTDLLNSIGKGRGSLLTSNYCDDDLLLNQQQDTPLFWMYMGAKDTWTNKYNGKISASRYFKGGATR